MKSTKFFALSLFATSVLLWSCNKEEKDPPCNSRRKIKKSGLNIQKKRVIMKTKRKGLARFLTIYNNKYNYDRQCYLVRGFLPQVL